MRGIVDTRNLVPRWPGRISDFEGLYYVDRKRRYSAYGEILRSLACLIVERADAAADLPRGPAVDLRAGPTIFDRVGPPPVARVEQRGGRPHGAAVPSSAVVSADLPYVGLDGEQQLLLTMLGVHPGPIIDREDAAALVGALTDEDGHRVGSQLERLCALKLLHDEGDGRYTMHERTRYHAGRRAAALPADVRDRAFDALVCRYAMWSHRYMDKAGWALLRHDTPATHRPPGPVVDGLSGALTWFTKNHENLLAILGLLGQKGVTHERIHPALLSLDFALAGYLRNRGPWNVAKKLHAWAAHRSAEPLAEAIALNNFAITCRLRGQLDPFGQDLDEAEWAGKRVVKIFSRQAADPRTCRMGRANAFNERGIVANERGITAARTGDAAGARRHHLEAEGHLRRARGLYSMRGGPDLIGRANAAKNLGVAYAGLDQPAKARSSFKRAFAEYGALGDALGEIEVLNARGRVLRHKGEKRAARRDHEAALEALHRGRVDSGLEEARAYEGLSLCRRARSELNGSFATQRFANLRG